jgi:16S rRNA (cytidine1402-2'-O)-methyltransferase
VPDTASPPDAGCLVLAATPIGDVEDASPRLRGLLASADTVAAEDTRRLRRLTKALDVVITGEVVSYHEHNEGTRTADLVERMVAGQTVLLVTDAGMPSVSDPGYRLVSACIDAGVPVTTAPGPSAALAALAVSGLPVDRFCFEGFLPRKGGQRRERLRTLTAEHRTMVFFEAPHRLGDVLSDMVELWGGSRPAAVCRELTKTYEEVRRGQLGELASWAGEGVRGEITLVVGGAPDDQRTLTDDELRDAVQSLVTSGQTRKDAVAEVSERTGVPRRRVYNTSL